AADLQRDRLREQRAGGAGGGRGAVELELQRQIELRGALGGLQVREQAARSRVAAGRRGAAARGRRGRILLIAAAATGGDESDGAGCEDDRTSHGKTSPSGWMHSLIHSAWCKEDRHQAQNQESGTDLVPRIEERASM